MSSSARHTWAHVCHMCPLAHATWGRRCCVTSRLHQPLPYGVRAASARPTHVCADRQKRIPTPTLMGLPASHSHMAMSRLLPFAFPHGHSLSRRSLDCCHLRSVLVLEFWIRVSCTYQSRGQRGTEVLTAEMATGPTDPWLTRDPWTPTTTPANHLHEAVKDINACFKKQGLPRWLINWSDTYLKKAGRTSRQVRRHQ